MFTYTPAGLVQQKWDYSQAAAFYTYDNEGRTVSTYYPFGGPSFTYTYDQMGRPIGLRDNQATPVDWVKDVAYNAAGQITSMSYARDPSGSSYYTETRQYNILQQLTRLTVPGVMDHEYRFSATQNDGRITQRKDWVSGEEITYQYDSLNRLISAQTTGPDWGQSFGYDGFGNLLSQTVTKGSAPSLNVTVDPATNRITNPGMSYDANGNLTAMPGRTMTYDTDNRMIAASGNFSYVYDPAGQRVRKNSEVIFYGVEGNLLATSAGGYNVYFGKKLIYNSTAAVVTDRLGSVVKIDNSTTTRYFPYGDEPTATQQDRPKFATYYRDATTALDYAQQRYYASTLARFTSPDRSGKNESLRNPVSLNRYAYVNGDPINFNDPSGEYTFGEYLPIERPASLWTTCAGYFNTYGSWHSGLTFDDDLLPNQSLPEEVAYDLRVTGAFAANAAQYFANKASEPTMSGIQTIFNGVADPEVFTPLPGTLLSTITGDPRSVGVARRQARHRSRSQTLIHWTSRCHRLPFLDHLWGRSLSQPLM